MFNRKYIFIHGGFSSQSSLVFGRVDFQPLLYCRPLPSLISPWQNDFHRFANIHHNGHTINGITHKKAFVLLEALLEPQESLVWWCSGFQHLFQKKLPRNKNSFHKTDFGSFIFETKTTKTKTKKTQDLFFAKNSTNF